MERAAAPRSLGAAARTARAKRYAGTVSRDALADLRYRTVLLHRNELRIIIIMTISD
jgi:hypothetical protein